MKRICVLALFATVVVGVASRYVSPVEAFPEFKKEFDKKYVKDPPTTPEETALATAVKTANCGLCHTKPPDDESSKKVRNTYGKAISKFIPDVIGKPEPTDVEKKGLRKAPAKIQSLLEKAAGEPSDAKDPKSPTFGELIKQGKLPGKDE
jgi:hypothetical protein